MKKRIFNVIVFFIIYYFIFNVIFTFTEVIVLKLCEYNANILSLFIEAIKNNLLFFALVYIIVFIIMYMKKKATIKKLNEQLKKVKEMKKNEQ